MSRAHLYFVALTCLFAAGCAGNRENVADNPAAAAVATPPRPRQQVPAAEGAATRRQSWTATSWPRGRPQAPICRSVPATRIPTCR